MVDLSSGTAILGGILFFLGLVLGCFLGAFIWAPSRPAGTRSQKMKTRRNCPICGRELDGDDDLVGKLKPNAVDKVLILGCRFCYKDRR